MAKGFKSTDDIWSEPMAHEADFHRGEGLYLSYMMVRHMEEIVGNIISCSTELRDKDPEIQWELSVRTTSS